jgi:RNA polymerase sigma factor (sigma-70 family)
MDSLEINSASAREKLVNENVGLIWLIARKLRRRVPSPWEMEDLIAPGYDGLRKAALLHNPSMQAFPKYAMHKIRFAMLDEIRDLSWCPKILQQDKNHKEKHMLPESQVEKRHGDFSDLANYGARDASILDRGSKGHVDSRDNEEWDHLLSEIGCDRLRQIVKLMVRDGLNQRECGERMGLSPSRIHQLEERAYQVLRKQWAYLTN